MECCPGCGGPGMLLGALGNLLHFRRRDCGAEYHEVVERQEEPRSEVKQEWEIVHE